MSNGSVSRSAYDDEKWYRYGLLSGVVFVALNVASLLVSGKPPARDAAAAKIAKYYVDNLRGIKAAAILFGFAMIFGLWWLGSLWRVISRLEPSGPRLALIAVVSFVMSGAVASGSQALFTAPALRPDALTGTTEFVWSVGLIGFSLMMAVIAAHMLALAALTMRTKFLPPWMGLLALLTAVAAALATGGAGSEKSIFLACQMIAFILWLLWVLLASVLLFMQKTA